MGDPGTTPPGKKADLTAPLAAAAALTVGVLASVGVSGGLLTRAVRNNPDEMAAVASAVLLIVGLAVVLAFRGSPFWAATTALLLLPVLVSVVFLGAGSLNDRELPRIAISMELDDDYALVSVEASASSMPSSDKMLVQVIALHPSISNERLFQVCNWSQQDSTAGRDFGAATMPNDENSDQTGTPLPLSDADGTLFAWQQAGADQDGKANLSFQLSIPRSYDGICGLAVLSKNPDDRDRTQVSYLRIPEP